MFFSTCLIRGFNSLGYSVGQGEVNILDVFLFYFLQKKMLFALQYIFYVP